MPENTNNQTNGPIVVLDPSSQQGGTRRDKKASSPLYFRPQDYSNLQWICRVKKILLNFNCMYIDDMVANPTQDILNFTEKIADQEDATTMLPREVFYEMYDAYVPLDSKAFDKFLDDHPGCLGISYETGVAEPIYSMEVKESIIVADRFLTFLNAMTNVSMGNTP